METSTKNTKLLAECHQRAILLQQALSKANILCAQKKKQHSMCSVDAKGNDGNECSSASNLQFNICDGTRASSSQDYCSGDNKTDKKEAHIASIKRHKLYPVLELMLKKCELATSIMSKDHFAMDDVCKLIAQLEEKGETIKSDDEELDQLIVNAVFALRIHLIELSKVFDLCTDFKLKYMQSLKKKMNQETMIGLSGDSDEDSGSPTGPIVFNDQRFLSDFQARNNTLAMLATANGMVTIPLTFFNTPTIHTPPNCSAVLSSGPGTSPTMFISKTKSDDIGRQSNHCSENFDDSRVGESCEEDERNEIKRKLPTKAVDLLKSWFYQHATHPYPTDNQKSELSKETGLHITQINNWFINARRRIMSNKTPNTSTQNSEETSDISTEWTPTLKKRKKDSKSGSCSYTIERFFSNDQKVPKVEN